MACYRDIRGWKPLPRGKNHFLAIKCRPLVVIFVFLRLFAAISIFNSSIKRDLSPSRRPLRYDRLGTPGLFSHVYKALLDDLIPLVRGCRQPVVIVAGDNIGLTGQFRVDDPTHEDLFAVGCGRNLVFGL